MAYSEFAINLEINGPGRLKGTISMSPTISETYFMAPMLIF
jgi:hypothetical protein